MNTGNNVHQNWPKYQEFLTHLADFFLCVCIQMFCSGPKWLSYVECSFIQWSSGVHCIYNIYTHTLHAALHGNTKFPVQNTSDGSLLSPIIGE